MFFFKLGLTWIVYWMAYGSRRLDRIHRVERVKCGRRRTERRRGIRAKDGDGWIIMGCEERKTKDEKLGREDGSKDGGELKLT